MRLNSVRSRLSSENTGNFANWRPARAFSAPKNPPQPQVFFAEFPRTTNREFCAGEQGSDPAKQGIALRGSGNLGWDSICWHWFSLKQHHYCRRMGGPAAKMAAGFQRSFNSSRRANVAQRISRSIPSTGTVDILLREGHSKNSHAVCLRTKRKCPIMGRHH